MKDFRELKVWHKAHRLTLAVVSSQKFGGKTSRVPECATHFPGTFKVPGKSTPRIWEDTLAVYKNTAVFPTPERYGLTSQMRRASASIPTNIAEGCGRGSDAELARFLQISMGSASELEYQLLLAKDLDYLSPPTYEQLHRQTVEVKKMLAPLINSLRSRR